ncbi:molybdopterin-guanine dinucleotide biosynthesis protein A [Planctomycetes bacterium Pan216]|uniref:Molybdopterin-guanine dinucleotide biosynthesis protein A n=1 Tax=Kolteria novifilia TaxID=2527975 RepID=A0A518AX07_9BACT|nr:molybdopterin-guanine dinucleotide biosynthesis protein A [Planctomycetes bacterium Pan216]
MNDAEDGYAIILAAGISSRMGRDKARLPWLEGRPLVVWMARALRESGWRVRVVLGPHNWNWAESELTDFRRVLNPQPEEGKSHSLRIGLEDCPSVGSVLITAVDQPRPPSIYGRLRAIAAADPSGIHLPDRKGRGGHPVVIGAACRVLLNEIERRPMGLRDVLDEHPDKVRRFAVPDDFPHCDCNDQRGYEEALATFMKGVDGSS